MFFKENIDFKVAKNTLMKIVLKDTGINDLESLLSGSTAVAISYDEPVAPAKVIKEFLKDSSFLALKESFLTGNILKAENMKNSPIYLVKMS